MAGSFKLAEWYVELGQRGLDKVLGSLDKIKASIAQASRGNFTALFGGSAAGAAAGHWLTEIVHWLVDCTREAAMAERNMVRYNRAVTNAMGGTTRAAQYTRDELRLMAVALGQTTGAGTAEIQAAMTRLLRFGNVQGEIFLTAIELADDYATMMGGTVVDAAEGIGRALQQPLQGMRLLHQMGVIISDQERRELKEMMSQPGGAGLIRAQLFLIERMKRGVGGVSADMSGTLWGQWQRIILAWKNAMQAVGNFLLPIVSKIIQAVRMFANAPMDTLSALGRVAWGAINGVFAYLKDILLWFCQAFPASIVNALMNLKIAGVKVGGKPMDVDPFPSFPVSDEMRDAMGDLQGLWNAVNPQANQAGARAVLNDLRKRPSLARTPGGLGKPEKVEYFDPLQMQREFQGKIDKKGEEQLQQLQEINANGAEQVAVQQRIADGIEGLQLGWA
jgi:hypothetical protein